MCKFARQVATTARFATDKEAAKIKQQINARIREGMRIHEDDFECDPNLIRLWLLVKTIKEDCLFLCRNDGPAAYIGQDRIDAEGYVMTNEFGMFKLVNREVFSNANFNSGRFQCASVWLLDNILTGQGSRLTDVDTWQGSDEADHKSMDFDDVFTTYKKKIAHKHNITIVQRSTTNFLVDEWANKSQYDFIYVDADHTTVGVLLDAELSWPLLKSGGIMAFDDLTWGSHLPPSQSPKAGILLFAERHKSEFDLVVANTQYWIKKK